jgi:hypothetical protein
MPIPAVAVAVGINMTKVADLHLSASRLVTI